MALHAWHNPGSQQRGDLPFHLHLTSRSRSSDEEVTREETLEAEQDFSAALCLMFGSGWFASSSYSSGNVDLIRAVWGGRLPPLDQLKLSETRRFCFGVRIEGRVDGVAGCWSSTDTLWVGTISYPPFHFCPFIILVIHFDDYNETGG